MDVNCWPYWIGCTLICSASVYRAVLARRRPEWLVRARNPRDLGYRWRSIWPELLTGALAFLWVHSLTSNSLRFWGDMEPRSGRAVLTTVLGGYWWEGHRLYEELGQLLTVLEPGHAAVAVAVQLVLGVVLQLVLVCLTGLVQLGLIEVPAIQPVPLVLLHAGLDAVARGELCAVPASWACLDGGYGLVPDPVHLLRVTGALVLPTHSAACLLDMAESLTHAWAVPGLDLKLDCAPGRAHMSFVHLSCEGGYYGQCLELQGCEHRTMPIVLDALRYVHSAAWWEWELHACYPHVGAGQPGGCELRGLADM
jgi:heme/copper-type cytochrome/quinol oxidase subunit 2